MGDSTQHRVRLSPIVGRRANLGLHGCRASPLPWPHLPLQYPPFPFIFWMTEFLWFPSLDNSTASRERACFLYCLPATDAEVASMLWSLPSAAMSISVSLIPCFEFFWVCTQKYCGQLLIILFIVFWRCQHCFPLVIILLLSNSPHSHQHWTVFGSSSKRCEVICLCGFYLNFCHYTLESLPGCRETGGCKGTLYGING